MSFARERSFWAAAFATVYAAGEAASSVAPMPGAENAVGALLGVTLVGLAGLWHLTRRDADADPETDVRSFARLSAVGTAIAILGLSGWPTARTAFVGSLGCALATVSGLAAILRAPTLGGLAAPSAKMTRLDLCLVLAFVWTPACLVPLARAIYPEIATSDLLVVESFLGLAAAGGSLLLSAFAALRALALRNAEVGIRERLGALAIVHLAALAAAATISLLGLGRAELAMTFAAAVGSTVGALACSAKDATIVGRTLSRLVGVLVAAAIPGLALFYLLRRFPVRTGELTLGFCLVVAILAGAVDWLMTRRFPRARERALALATRATENTEAEVALNEVLFALHSLGGKHTAPILVRLDPPRIVRTDLSGSIKADKGEFPSTLAELTKGEPLAILRRAALARGTVRFPEARPVLQWFDDEGVDALAMMSDSDGPLGFLGFPRTNPPRVWALRDLEHLRRLADRLTVVVSAADRLARSLEREATLRARGVLLDVRAGELEKLVVAREGHASLLVEHLAEHVRIATYSPAARFTRDRVSEVANGGSVVLLAFSGVDAIGWAALIHLSSRRARAPFVVLACTDPVFSDFELWRSEERSPLRRAREGSLVLVDPQCLPALVQAYIGASMREAPEDPLIVSIVPATVDVLLEKGQLEESFADKVGKPTIPLPPLSARGEDLRALALHMTAKLGQRFHRRPVALEPSALAVLVDHEWYGNDAEFEGVLTRAVASCDGHTVRKADLGLSPPPRARKETRPD